MATSWSVDCDVLISRPAHMQVDWGALEKVDPVSLLLLLLALDQTLKMARMTSLSKSSCGISPERRRPFAQRRLWRAILGVQLQVGPEINHCNLYCTSYCYHGTKNLLGRQGWSWALQFFPCEHPETTEGSVCSDPELDFNDKSVFPLKHVNLLRWKETPSGLSSGRANLGWIQCWLGQNWRRLSLLCNCLT